MNLSTRSTPLNLPSEKIFFGWLDPLVSGQMRCDIMSAGLTSTTRVSLLLVTVINHSWYSCALSACTTHAVVYKCRCDASQYSPEARCCIMFLKIAFSPVVSDNPFKTFLKLSFFTKNGCTLLNQVFSTIWEPTSRQWSTFSALPRLLLFYLLASQCKQCVYTHRQYSYPQGCPRIDSSCLNQVHVLSLECK